MDWLQAQCMEHFLRSSEETRRGAFQQEAAKGKSNRAVQSKIGNQDAGRGFHVCEQTWFIPLEPIA